MTLINFLTGIWPILAGALGGISAVAIAAFTKFGDRFSEYLVSRQIESFKHGLEAKIEQLRARLAHFTDRGVRSNELEYAAIIAAWEHFVDAYVATYNCIVSAISHPDFTHMSDDEVAQYLKGTAFSEEQQQQMLRSSDRNKMFSKITELRLIAIAGKAIFDARSVLRKQGIFIPKELEDEFDKALQIFHEAQIQRHMEFDYGHMRDVQDKKGPFFKDGQRMYDEIKMKVRNRILAQAA